MKRFALKFDGNWSAIVIDHESTNPHPVTIASDTLEQAIDGVRSYGGWGPVVIPVLAFDGIMSMYEWAAKA